MRRRLTVQPGLGSHLVSKGCRASSWGLKSLCFHGGRVPLGRPLIFHHVLAIGIALKASIRPRLSVWASLSCVRTRERVPYPYLPTPERACELVVAGPFLPRLISVHLASVASWRGPRGLVGRNGLDVSCHRRASRVLLSWAAYNERTTSWCRSRSRFPLRWQPPKTVVPKTGPISRLLG